MTKPTWAKHLAAGLALSVALTASPGAAERPGSFADRLLAAHNRERERVGVPRLAWSARLAAEAHAWATRLESRGRFEHDGDRGEAGENLWIGTAGRFSPEEMVGAFLREKPNFAAGVFPRVSRTGRWSDVGHYSQMIWPTTAEVGCALVRARTNDVLVCRYFPAGNVVGGWVG